jgi:hypothetical protein
MTTEERLVALEVSCCERFKRIGEKFDAIEHARRIQFDEYARRLSDLNHEAERLRVMQVSYVPRELFERLDEEVEALQSFRDTLIGKMAIVGGLAGLIGAAISALLVKLVLA